MSTFSKKLVGAVLTATTATWMSGAMFLLPVAHAQTTADLQAQIAALLAQIQQLQAQLSAQTGSPSSSYVFTRDLTVGSRGADVTALQQILIARGFLKIAAPTGYFGPLTQAAVAAWQASVGVAPTAGYFGPKSRAAMAGTGVPPVGPITPIPGSGVAVSLSAANPAAGSLISSATGAAGRVPVFAFDVAAGTASGITINEIRINKNGVLSDSSISGAYLLSGNQVLSQFTSISQGVIAFSNLGLLLGAGQAKTLTLAIDPATGLSAGNTVGFGIAAGSNVKAVDAANAAANVSGFFPLNGNTFTVTSVSNPPIATITVATSGIGTSVDAGTTGNLVGAWNFTVQNSKTWLKSIDFRVIGSANKTDLRNVMLKVNGVQAGPTLASVSSDGHAYFDLGSTQTALNTGSNNIQVFADVLGSPSFTFQFEILNSYDMYVVDSQYNVPITGASNVGTQVSINSGRVTVTTATDTPTGNVAKTNGTVLAKFNIYAAGEAVKVKWLGFQLNFTGTFVSNDAEIKNIALTDDAGGQVGSTVNSLGTTVTCTDSAQSNSSSSITNCFGSSGSPINYIVPANTTRVLSLKADIQSTASFSTVVGKLVGNTSNLQGLTSSQTASSAAANGSALTLVASSLTAAKNTAVGTQTVTAPAQSKKIGSYSLTASSAEGASISTVTITTGAAGASFANLLVKVGNPATTQFGTTYGVLAASTAYSFSGSPFTVGAGATTYVEIYADTLSSATAGTKATMTTLSSCSGNGVASLSAITCSSTAGQDVVVAGQSTLSVTADSAQAPVGQLVMGSSGNPLATFRFTETSNVENVKINDLNVYQQVATTGTVKSAFQNVTLYNGSTPLGTAGAAIAGASSTPGGGYIYQFHFASPVIVPQGNSISLVLKGDVASYSSSGASDNTTHVFKIATSTDTVNDTVLEAVNALGASSNATSAVANPLAVSGNSQQVLRSKLTFSATSLGATSGRVKQTADNLATLTFTSDPAGSVVVNTVTVTFAGTSPSHAGFLDNVTLIDENGNTLGTGNTTSTACNGSNTCSKTFKLGATTAGQVVSAGSSRSWTLRANSLSNSFVAGANISASLSATVNATTDLMFTDALDSAAVSTLSLPSSVVTPINILSTSYVSGT